MAKKRKGFLAAAWPAMVWLSTSFLHIFYLVTKGAIWIGSLLFAKLSAAAQKQARARSRPSSGAVFQPLALQKQSSGELGDFENRLLSSKSMVGIILGARGSGKSALGMRLLENISAKTGRAVCAMGFEESSLPAWIAAVDGVESVPNGAFVLVDEGGITFSSRSSMSSANKVLSSLLFVARHKDISALFIAQNSSNLEVNAMRQADCLLLRRPSLLQKDFERKIIADIYDAAQGGFASLPQQGKHSTYVYSDEFRGFVSNSLPSFWSDKASRGFAKKSIGAGKN